MDQNQDVVLELLEGSKSLLTTPFIGDSSVVRAVIVGYTYLASWPDVTQFIVRPLSQLSFPLDKQTPLWVGKPGDEFSDKPPIDLMRELNQRGQQEKVT